MRFRRDAKEGMDYIKRPLYPKVFNAAHRRHRIVVGIGGNLGDMLRRFEHLIWYLRRDPMVSLHQSSIVVENPPFGYRDQPRFLNSVLVLESNLSAPALMRHLLRIEKRFGRRRSFANAPRTLDLDMLFYDAKKLNTPMLTLPHPQWFRRASVVIPLYYLGV